jgi:hypothetical protein
MLSSLLSSKTIFDGTLASIMGKCDLLVKDYRQIFLVTQEKRKQNGKVSLRGRENTDPDKESQFYPDE